MDAVTDPFLTSAGPAPAGAPESLWRQVALLSASSAIAGNTQAASGLAAALAALDHPAEAAAVAEGAPVDDPWAVWWRTLAAGQSGEPDRLEAALADARRLDFDGPDGRDVARRLDDLADELATLRGDSDEGRFAVLGHRARPERRALLGGRSSAAFLIDPEWEALHLVRLAPSDGPRAGNRAHLTRDEIISRVRSGDAGAGREVPPDRPPELEPDVLLTALREDSRVRDRRLLELAEEVREERHRLRHERAALEEERAQVRARAREAQNDDSPLVPRSVAEAAQLLQVMPGAPPAEVERAYKGAVVRCHPDRVADLHPAIRGRAEELTVALNAARDLLSANGANGNGRAARRAR